MAGAEITAAKASAAIENLNMDAPPAVESPQGWKVCASMYWVKIATEPNWRRYPLEKGLTQLSVRREHEYARPQN